uniref:MHC class I-like antigen recognition-like domain-containing protein n=1 Tax=Anabas testudineus TaxID=64144 RepID=A0AAQ6I914_ANATE
MMGGLFIYNHKGEVLISRVSCDKIGDSGLWLSSELRNWSRGAVSDHQPGHRSDRLEKTRNQIPKK